MKSIRDMPKLVRAISWCELSFTWFAAEHAFPAVVISKALGKRSFVVAGGYDVAYEKDIDYGQFTLSWPKRAMTRFVLEQADAVLAVSNFTKKEVLKRARPKALKLIHNGIDVSRFEPGVLPKENIAMTVGGISLDTILRKGLAFFVKSARFVPEARFVIVGRDIDGSMDYLKSIASDNVEFRGQVSDEELLAWYRRAKVYVQASAYESFGVALAEAMLCGCIPVVTDRGALPEVVGGEGFYAPFGDEKELGNRIKTAMGSDLTQGARKRIMSTFSLERREAALIDLIKDLI